MLGMARPPSPAIMLFRRQLADELVRSLGPGSQHVLAPHFGIAQPRMSELSRGYVGRCSVEWLIGTIHRLGGSVRIEVTLGGAAREARRSRFAAMRARRGVAGGSTGELIPNME